MSIYSKQQIHEAVSSIKQLLNNVDNDSQIISLLSEGDKHMIRSGFYSLLGFKVNHKLEEILFSLILEHALLSERLGPGSFLPCIRACIEGILTYDLMNPTNNESHIINTCSSMPSESELEDIVISHCSDEYTKTLVRDAINLAGFLGKITVEKSKNENTIIELKNGFNFQIQNPCSVEFNEKNVKVLVIDGHVENVSDIHHFLSECSDSKAVVLLVCRGASNDVLNTLSMNHKRRTLNVFPVIVPYDVYGINMVADISVISGSIPFSTMKGDLLSSIRLSQLKYVKCVKLSGNELSFQLDEIHDGIKLHVKNLKTKKDEVSIIEDMSNIYSYRLKSLIPNIVVISVSDKLNFSVINSDIDLSLRKLKSLVDYGWNTQVNGRKTLAACDISASVFSRKLIDKVNGLSFCITTT
jgi:hypothetical protein